MVLCDTFYFTLALSIDFLLLVIEIKSDLTQLHTTFQIHTEQTIRSRTSDPNTFEYLARY